MATMSVMLREGDFSDYLRAEKLSYYTNRIHAMEIKYTSTSCYWKQSAHCDWQRIMYTGVCIRVSTWYPRVKDFPDN